VTERPDLTAQGYRRFRWQACGTQFNERGDGALNRTLLPTDIIAFVVFCRLLQADTAGCPPRCRGI
jgi:putative transposase